MSGDNSPKRRPGRPPRVSTPFVIRGVVPETHPHYERLKALGSAGAARALLHMLANPLKSAQDTHGSNATPVHALAPNSLNLNFSPSPANSIQATDQTNAQPVAFDADLADLIDFTGG